MLAETPLFRRGEALVYDARARLAAGLATPDPAIAIVVIDDNSLEVYADVLDRWPWPRDGHAALVQYLHAAGARLVVFDVHSRQDPRRSGGVGDGTRRLSGRSAGCAPAPCHGAGSRIAG
jgi:CHASE2 domain-containing sensor protein